jgi:CRP-like cAMP-binding protein
MSQHPFQNFMVRYRAGERIFDECDAASTMFIVHAGKVGLFRQAHESKDSMGVMEKGDFFGEMSILSGLPRTNSAEALEDVDLIEINSMIFDKMIRGNIEIAIRMLRKLSIRLRESERRLSELHAAGVRAAPQSATGQASARQPAGEAASGARLEAEGRDTIYPLADGETIIGRYDPVTELKPDVDLTDLDLRRSVSRQHARIRKENSGFVVVVEVGALHGTSVNGTPIDPGEPSPIVDGDHLSVGDVAMVFRT